MSYLPLVTIIVPTTRDRVVENEYILSTICRQDYPHKEVLFDFEDGTIGMKRNRLCEKAAGEIVTHFDSDDRYANDWVSKQVRALIDNKADIVGLREFYFYDAIAAEGWKYTYPPTGLPFVAGATMMYWRNFWYQNMFQDISMAEDVAFAFKTRNIWAHDYIEGFVASIHGGNTCVKPVNSDPYYRRCSVEENEGIRKRFFR